MSPPSDAPRPGPALVEAMARLLRTIPTDAETRAVDLPPGSGKSWSGAVSVKWNDESKI